MKTCQSQKLTSRMVKCTDREQTSCCLWQGRRVQERPGKRLPRSMGLFRMTKCFKADCGTGCMYLKPMNCVLEMGGMYVSVPILMYVSVPIRT